MTRFNALKPSSLVGSFKASALGERVEASKASLPNPQSYYPFETIGDNGPGVSFPNWTPDVIAGRNLSRFMFSGGESNYTQIDGLIGKGLQLAPIEGFDPNPTSLTRNDSFFAFPQSWQLRIWIRYDGLSSVIRRFLIHTASAQSGLFGYSLALAQPNYDPDTNEPIFAPFSIRYLAGNTLITHPSQLSPDDWHHLFYFYDKPNHLTGLYIDTQLHQVTADMRQTNPPLTITPDLMSGVFAFDELAFWDNILFTPDQVAADFASREPLA